MFVLCRIVAKNLIFTLLQVQFPVHIWEWTQRFWFGSHHLKKETS